MNQQSDDQLSDDFGILFNNFNDDDENADNGFDNSNNSNCDFNNDRKLKKLKIQQLQQLDQQKFMNLKNVENLLDKYSLDLFSPILQLAQTQNEEKQLQAETIKNLTRFSSCLECKQDQCQLQNLREHFHCYVLPCSGKILNKKDEIIRHIKWHKKRNESLNHGFLRYSSSDDCSIKFQNQNCQHNHKQTHYHCIQSNCDKIYISTSDVQMHSNYHRKHTAIIQEGFQRYRATEECNADYCIFSAQRTTHFHCRRDNCRFTFKNKADIEKHKSYHIKDLQLAQDGFKKFLKNELCSYEGCRFSNVCNHIHCVRDNCYYVLHSSGQLLSHKRKHDRLDGEQAYQRYKLLQKQIYDNNHILNNNSELSIDNNNIKTTTKTSSTLINKTELLPIDLTYLYNSNINLNNNEQISTQTPSATSIQATSSQATTSEATTSEATAAAKSAFVSIEFMQQMQERHQELLKQHQQQHIIDNKNLLISLMFNNINKINSNLSTSTAATSKSILNNIENNFDDIDFMIRKYFTTNCTNQINNNNSSISINIDNNQPLNLNLQNNNEENVIIECKFTSITTSKILLMQKQQPPPHLHCLYKNCGQIIEQNLIDLIEHIQLHELNNNNNSNNMNNDDNDLILTNTSSATANNLMQITSIDGFFNRKRGRPPKNRVVELYNNKQESPEAVFTSFKLEKNCTTGSGEQQHQQQQISPLPYTQTITNLYQKYLPTLTSTATATTTTVATSNNLAGNTTVTTIPTAVNQNIIPNKYDCDDEKISVVRAAGTYFPINTSTNSNTNINDLTLQENQEAFDKNSNNNDNQQEDHQYNQQHNKNKPISLAICNRSFCKLKRKTHQHCEFCNQAFSDDIKFEIHKLKHCTASAKLLKTTILNQNNNNNDTIDNHNESNIINYDQPEDLSIQQQPISPLPKSSSSTSSSLSSSSPEILSPLLSKSLQHHPINNNKLLSTSSSSSVIQNLHLAQLALYKQQQQNSSMPSLSYYCQQDNIYPLSTSFSSSELTRKQNNDNTNKESSAASSSINLFPLFLNSTTIPSLTASTATKQQQKQSIKNISSNKRKLPLSFNYDNNNIIDDNNLQSNNQQQQQLPIKKLYKSSSASSSSSINLKIFKDEPIPNGYLKFRFNEDCNFQICGYRNHQSHFHCIRIDCYYSFCDRTRFVQHTARHERLDKLMGDDFKQYRANMKCNYEGCAYTKNWIGRNNKSSHFHCLKCNFICSDTNKVVAHRRQHNKAEYVRMAGFRKIATNEKCPIQLTTTINIDNSNQQQQNDECSYSLKHTHYHCLICDAIVLSRAQLNAHKHRTT